jgi:23S rRNA (uracil1939-C5)-methyltransferase
MRKKKRTVVEQVVVSGYAAEGKSIAKVNGKVAFVEGAVPGDVVDLLVTRNKKEWTEGRAIRFHHYSTERVTPFCSHFGLCGGCKWQMLPYKKQLEYKQKEVEENLKRIGKVELPEISPIIGAAHTKFYRNKLEYTFSNKRYLAEAELERARSEGSDIETVMNRDQPALGYHVPKIFDKVIDIRECYLQEEPSNQIRNLLREFAIEQRYSFYDIRKHQGWLRNLIIRLSTTGELMVNICFGYEDKEEQSRLFDHLLSKVPAITTLLYTINPKFNDSIFDLTPKIYSGKGYIIEKLEEFQFKVGPKSFFQTNTKQAERLYQVVREFSCLSGNETVYDLYCGTGTIGIFISALARKVVGVESIGDAVLDAKENAAINGVEHATFFEGDVINICNEEFFASHGKPGVIITDPPRAGMHEKMVKKIVETEAPLVVYVSCNTATQARDLYALNERYNVEAVQPVDMFPHTHHIENIVQLKLRNL